MQNFSKKDEQHLHNNLSAITYQNDLVSKSHRNIFHVKKLKDSKNNYILEDVKTKL